MAKRKARKAKKIILAVTAAVLVAAMGVGIWWFTAGKPKEPVKVYSFNYLGMTEYWGDNQESYGPVITDRIQTVKFYPEGNAETRLQLRGMGQLYWYCNRHGLFRRKFPL